MDDFLSYFEDENFVRWVYSSDEQLNSYWKSYLEEHPDEKDRIKQARLILSQLKSKKRDANPFEVYRLFSSIQDTINRKKKENRFRRILIPSVKYAAVILFFFSIAVVLKEWKQSQRYKIYTELPDFKFNDACLITADGKDILLKEKESEVEYQDMGKVVINKRDTITTASSASSRDMNQLIVPYGRNSSVTLSDGTIAFLNAGSSLVYPSVFGKKNREVFLVGEGYFQVAHNPEKPFVVKTNKLNVRALGTCFNVQAYPEDDIIEVVLVEGKVSLSDNTFRFINKDYMLKPNQLASYNVKNSETTVRQVDPENYVSWYEGYMNFESIELSRIVLKLERFYNIRLKLDNPFMGGKKISGKLKLKENKDEVLEILASTASAKLIKLDEQIYVLK